MTINDFKGIIAEVHFFPRHYLDINWYKKYAASLGFFSNHSTFFLCGFPRRTRDLTSELRGEKYRYVSPPLTRNYVTWTTMGKCN